MYNLGKGVILMVTYFKDEFTFLSELKDRIEKRYVVNLDNATTRQVYNVLGEMVSEEISKQWMKTNQLIKEKTEKEVYYFFHGILDGKINH